MDIPSHIVMFPWFAMGHLTPYLHFSNKLASRGYKISFFIPKKTQTKLQHLNLHRHLITFFPITVPPVHGLPHGAETTSDVPFSLFPLIATAMDHTEKDIELLLMNLKPQIVFFDFQHWLPTLARKWGIKCMQYFIVNPLSVAYFWNGPRKSQGGELTDVDLMKPPEGFPDSSIKLHAHEVRFLAATRKLEFGRDVLLYDRWGKGTSLADAIGFKGCREIDGPYAEYLETVYGKPVLLSGPLLPEPPNSTLEEKWVAWLSGFNHGSVVFCAFGSESPLPENQFQELLLGLELTGFPFLAAFKPPNGFESVEEALPDGFRERVKGRGIAYGGWVPQQLILEHPSVGCFITHCGAASLTEALVNKCRLVFLPRLGADHVINARSLSRKLKVGVEVEKGEEDGLFSKESICKAVKSLMDDDSEVAREVRQNHAKLRNFLLSDNLESSCVDLFCQQLQNLL
ncbi:anthocyanidin 3-O-glucoside 2''-O-glucosyltransferase [Vigna radiata var. radiata]|uniref:Anthocyanidin 3-O-glucoside 2''-O-glucosyltransferase n=1 Tax=Vigna radiata var. radiata TaxID=3916 RepID=A0A1S3VV24_VIGRR|nr:anthocyanidin 3-O-glucoside 2''-O-glucosyltransferase [Vigna radiata var. radiata]WMX26793.1 UGT79B151 [Vigna radiata var. radiata]